MDHFDASTSVHPQLRKIRISAPRSNSSSSTLSEGLAAVSQEHRRGTASPHAPTPPISVPPPSATLSHFDIDAEGSFHYPGHVSHSPPKGRESKPARHPSITFNQNVTIEGGRNVPLQDPLPKPASSLSASDFESYFSQKSANNYTYKPADIPRSAPRNRYDQNNFGSNRSYAGSDDSHSSEQPLYVKAGRRPVCSGMDEQERVASLTTSESTASPPADEVKTPPSAGADLYLSPISTLPEHTNSLQDEVSSSPWPWLHAAQRSKSFTTSRREGRAARKSSCPSPMSPASMFLRSMRQQKAPEPDDEGQEIGNYIIGKTIGFGGFSVVKEAHTIENGNDICRAVKIVKKQVRDKEAENEAIQAEFEHEVNLWRHLSHPYILDLISVYDTPYATFCITRYNIGGTLFDLVKKNRSGIAPELAQKYCFQLASALRYLHYDMHVVHRDVKLENILLNTKAGDGGDILLCDFGMAEYIHSAHSDGDSDNDAYDHRTRMGPKKHGPADTSSAISCSSTTPLIGSLQYASPELIESDKVTIETSVDMWAFGIVVFALHCGSLPFHHGLQQKLQAMIVEARWDEELLASKESPLFPGVVDVAQGCLDKDPESRWDVRQVLESKWLDRWSDFSP